MPTETEVLLNRYKVLRQKQQAKSLTTAATDSINLSHNVFQSFFSFALSKIYVAGICLYYAKHVSNDLIDKLYQYNGIFQFLELFAYLLNRTV